MMSSKPHVTIYTDGGADPNPGPGGWAVVLIHDATGSIKEMAGGDPATTSNRMELTAAIRALEALKRPCAVRLYTDSEYLQKGITKWVDQWQRSGWMRSGGKEPVKNADLWQQLIEVMRPHDVTWEWLKGHAGDEHNERADQLARQAIRAQHRMQPVEEGFSGAEVYLTVSAQGERGFWAALIRYEGEEDVVVGEEANASSNRLDIVAAANALTLLPEGIAVRVYTLSDYLRNGATRWLGEWRRRGWLTKSGEPVANQEDWEWLAEELTYRRVRWPIVKADDPPGEFELLALRAQEEFEDRDPLSDDFSDIPPGDDFPDDPGDQGI